MISIKKNYREKDSYIGNSIDILGFGALDHSISGGYISGSTKKILEREYSKVSRKHPEIKSQIDPLLDIDVLGYLDKEKDKELEKYE